MKHEGSEKVPEPSRYDLVMQPEYQQLKKKQENDGFHTRSKSTVMHRHTVGRASSRNILGQEHAKAQTRPSARTLQLLAAIRISSSEDDDGEDEGDSDSPDEYEEAQIGTVDPTHRLSKFLHMNANEVGRLVSPADRIQHVHHKTNPRPRILYYDRMTAFLFTPGDPTIKWYCHLDGKMHDGMKPSSQYVALIKFIGTHDPEKDDWNKDYEHEEEATEEHHSIGHSLPSTPRRASAERGDSIRRNLSTTDLPRLLEKMEKNLKHERIKDLPKVYVSWFGVTNAKAITPYLYDRECKVASFNVSTYTQTTRNFGMHKNVPVYLPSCFLAQEGGYRRLRPSEAGRECAVFMDKPLSDREWKCEFGGYEHVYVKSEQMYRIDEAYIDMDRPINPLEEIIME